MAIQAARKLPFPGAVDHEVVTLALGPVTFTLYAPGKRSVRLIGDFNEWNPKADEMYEIAEGLWTIEKELPRGSFAYQFQVDENLAICDPYAQYYEKDVGGLPVKAVVRVREDPYVWHHDDYRRPPFSDLMIFEMHIADYTPMRSFREAAQRMPYIHELGMNAVEIMPVFGMEEHKGWGYTPTMFFAPNADYGTPNELRWLIDEAHGNGLAVILDIVLAHTGQGHPFNKMYPYDQSPWYGQGPAGGNEFGLPQLNYSKPATRAFAKDVLEFWMREYHVDGFRFDYAKSIGMTSEGHGLPTLVQVARDIQKDVYLIGEILPENPSLGIDSGMDAQWHVRFSYAMKALLTRRQTVNYDPNNFEEAIRVLDAVHQGYGAKPTAMVNYLESHDEERMLLALKNAGADEDTARRKDAMAATILFTAVGEPMIYHGQTWGQDTPRNMDHNYIDWESLATPIGRQLHEHYLRVIHLRQQRGALRTTNIVFDGIYSDKQSVVYHRWDGGGDVVVVVANFSESKQTIPVPIPQAGKWREFFSNQEMEIGGNVEMDLEPWSAKVLLKI